MQNFPRYFTLQWIYSYSASSSHTGDVIHVISESISSISVLSGVYLLFLTQLGTAVDLGVEPYIIDFNRDHKRYQHSWYVKSSESFPF